MRFWRSFAVFFWVLTAAMPSQAIDSQLTLCAAQLSILPTDQAREIFVNKTDRVIDLEIKRVTELRKSLEKSGLYAPAIARADAYVTALKGIQSTRSPKPRVFLLDEGLLDDSGFLLDGPDEADSQQGPADPELDDTDYIAAPAPTNSSLLKLGINPKVGDLSPYLTPAKAKRPPATEYFDPTIEKLPAGFERLFQFTLADPLFGPRLLENIETMGKTPETITEREKLMVMVQEAEIRGLLEAEAYNLLYQRAERTRKFLRENPDTVWDWVDYGAGLHNQNSENYKRLNAPDIVSLTIEKTPQVASNFAQGGSAFTLNSGSRNPDRSSLRQRFGEGDLNYLSGGAVQVHQFDNSSNPPASSFAVSILINRALSDNPILFEEDASDFELDSIVKGEPIFAARTQSGLKIRTRGGAGAGLGQESLPPIPGLAEAYQEAKAAVEGTGKLPTIAVYGDLFRFASKSERPLTEVSEEEVAVVGAGDSGNAVVRVFIRSNALPSQAFGRDSASVRGPKRISWYNQICTTCELFLSEKRSFYYDIAKGYRNGQIDPIEFKITGFKKLPDGRYRLTDSSGKTRIVKYVVFTTGFDSLAPQYFAPLVGDRNVEGRPNDFANNPELFRDIIGYEPTLGTSPSKPAAVTLARQFLLPDGSSSRLLLWGPKAGNIVSEAEKKQIGENSVANANHVWRVWNTTEALVEDLRANNPSGLKGDPAAKAPAPVEPLKLLRGRKTDIGVVVDIPAATKSLAGKPGDSILFPTRLLGALDGLDLKQLPRVVIVLTRTDDGRLRLRLEPALDSAQLQSVATNIVSDATLVRLIQSALQNGSVRTLRAEFAFDAQGRILGQDFEIQRSKSVDGLILQGLSERASSSVSADIAGRVRTSIFDSRNRLVEKYNGPSGYAQLAEDQFEGDMALTYDALVAALGSPAAVKERVGVGYRFTGTLTQHRQLREWVGRVNGRNRDSDVERLVDLSGSSGFAAEGLRKASEFFDNSPSAAYDAAVQMYSELFVEKLGWFRFSGSVEQLVELRNLVNSGTRGLSFNERPREYYIAESKAFGPRGQARAAALFGDSMDAAYEAALEMYGEPFTTEQLRWYRFSGTVAQNEAIRKKVNTLSGYASLDVNDRPTDYVVPNSQAFGPRGYADLANLLQLQMGQTYDLLNQIYGEDFVVKKLQWRRFNGTAEQYSQLRQLVNRMKNSYTSPEFNARPTKDYLTYSAASAATGLSEATKIFGGDLKRTFEAAIEVYGSEYVVEGLGWYRVTNADIEEHDGLRRFVNELNSYSNLGFNDRPSESYTSYSKAYGQSGYFETAQRLFGGDLDRAYDTAVEIYGRPFVDSLKWQRIPEVAVDANNVVRQADQIPAAVTLLRKRIYSNPLSTKPNLIAGITGTAGVVKYATQYTNGDIGVAVEEIEQTLGSDTVSALGWPKLNITVKQVAQVENRLPSTAFFGTRNGYAKKYRNGDGLLLAAREIFGGNVGLTKQAVAAILGAESIEKLGWN